MCTVSWLPQENGYQLFCNRDEKLARLPARGPSIAECEGVRYISPEDADRGGTWIAANELGVGICLLNGPARPGRSRGWIVRDLAGARSAQDGASRLAAMPLGQFAPFTLLLLEPGRAARVLHWTGESLIAEHGGAPAPLTSSSFDADGVRAARLAHFRSTGSLHEFHHSHAPEPGPYSVCMHRQDARTVSFSQIQVSAGAVTFLYSPDAPCRQAPAEQVILARRAL